MKVAISVLAVGASVCVVGLARAQVPEALPPPTYVPAERPVVTEKPLSAPARAFELTVGTGYTQPFGSLKSGVGMPSVATAGLALDLGLGYRIDPKVAVMWTGQYQEFTAERSAGARGASAGIGVQYHMRPMQQLDPWVDASAGYRVLWETQPLAPTIMTHGLDVARVRVGLDIKSGDNMALGPMIGADATVFLFQDGANLATNIAEPRVSTFIYAGLQGRFDIGGTRVREVQTVSQR